MEPPLLLPPPQPTPAVKNTNSISPNPAIRRRCEGTPRKKMPANRALLPAANQPKPRPGCGEITAPDRECGAVVVTVSADVPDPFATEGGANKHVGAGVPPPVTLQARLTVPVKPPVGAMVIVEVAVPPAATLAGASVVRAIVKSGVAGALTVRLIDVVWLTDPEVPVTVMLEVAVGVAAAVVMVRVEVPDATGVGANAQVTPVGRLEVTHVRSTMPVNPFVADTVTVDVPDCPGAETMIGVPPTEKSGVETKVGHDVTSTSASMEPNPVTKS